ncbi:hypothetical protein BB560_000855, partial [Smittium megazygosporum]
LRHEILFESKLEFKPKAPQEGHQSLLDTNSQYWAKLAKDLKNYCFFKSRFLKTANPGSFRILKIFSEIKGIFEDLFEDLEYKPDVYKFNNMFDEPSLMHQIQKGKFVPDQLIEYILSLLYDISDSSLKPRIDQIAKHARCSDYINALKECLLCLEKIKMNVANKAIESYRGYLKSTAAVFEKNQFETTLSTSSIDTKHHLPWWESVYLKNKSEYSNLFNIFMAGFHEDVFFDKNNLPNLFQADESRIFSVRNQIKKLSTFATLMLANKQLSKGVILLKKNNNAQISHIRTITKVVNSQILLLYPNVVFDGKSESANPNSENIRSEKMVESILSKSGEILAGYNITIFDQCTSELNSLFKSIIEPESVLLNSVKSKLCKAFVNLIAGLDSNPTKTLNSLNLAELAYHIHQVLENISPILEHHWSVYGEYYHELTRKHQVHCKKN